MRREHAHPGPARRWLAGLWLIAGLIVWPGCDSDNATLSNSNPGPNSKSVVVAFGDSITMGNRCPCTPYPQQLGPLIGKTVYNTGIGGTTSRGNVGRCEAVIGQFRPAYMLIMYGINDIIQGGGVAGALAGLDEMIRICKGNQVAPALATYPVPVKSYRAFAGGILALNQGIRRLASTHGIPLVDLEREFALPGFPNAAGDIQSDPDLFTGEGLHPNATGTRIMARVFAELF